jgi:hypothetical protein
MKKTPFAGSFGEVLVPPVASIGVSAVYRAFNLGFKEQQSCMLKTYLTKPGTLIPVEKPSVSMSTYGIRLGDAGHVTPRIQSPKTKGPAA